MRHHSAYHNLSRHPAHRRAMLRNMVINLVRDGRVRTTIQKAKAARSLAEKLITLGKKGTLHHRRLATEALGSTAAAKAAVRDLFGTLRERFAQRNGGYTRILRLPRTIRQAKVDLPRSKAKRGNIYGTRLGDNSTMVLWEWCEAEITKRPRKPRKVRSKKPKAKPAEPQPVEQKPAEQQPAEQKPAEPPQAETSAAAPASEQPVAAAPAPAEGQPKT